MYLYAYVKPLQLDFLFPILANLQAGGKLHYSIILATTHLQNYKCILYSYKIGIIHVNMNDVAGKILPCTMYLRVPY